MSQPVGTIRLQGRSALIAVGVILLIAVGYGYYRLHQMRNASEALHAQILTDLDNEYAGRWLARIEAADRPGLSRRERNEILDEAGEQPVVEIESLDIRGGLSKRGYARVQFTVDGETPAADEGVRYYRIGFSSLTAWRGNAIRVPAMTWQLAFPR